MLDQLKDGRLINPGREARNVTEADISSAGGLLEALHERDPLIDGADEGDVYLPGDVGMGSQETDVVTQDLPVGDALGTIGRAKGAAGSLDLALVVKAKAGGDVQDEMSRDGGNQAEQEDENGTHRAQEYKG